MTVPYFENWAELLREHGTKEGLVGIQGQFSLRDASAFKDVLPVWAQRIPKHNGTAIYTRKGSEVRLYDPTQEWGIWVTAEIARLERLTHEALVQELSKQTSVKVLQHFMRYAGKEKFQRQGQTLRIAKAAMDRLDPEYLVEGCSYKAPLSFVTEVVQRCAVEHLKHFHRHSSADVRVEAARRVEDPSVFKRDPTPMVRRAAFYRLSVEHQCQMLGLENSIPLSREMIQELPDHVLSQFRGHGDALIRQHVAKRISFDELKSMLKDSHYEVRAIAVERLPLDDLLDHTETGVVQDKLLERFREAYKTAKGYGAAVEPAVDVPPAPDPQAAIATEKPGEPSHPTGIADVLADVGAALDEDPETVRVAVNTSKSEEVKVHRFMDYMLQDPSLKSSVFGGAAAAVLERAFGSKAAYLTAAARDQALSAAIEKGLK